MDKAVAPIFCYFSWVENSVYRHPFFIEWMVASFPSGINLICCIYIRQGGGRGDMESKDQPKEVFGIIYHPKETGDKEKEHAHEIFLISWDGRPVHVHPFSGVTSFDVGHRHRYIGTTKPAPSGVPHRHAYYTVTTVDDGHSHVIEGVTGQAIPLPGGGHYHFFRGVTTVNGMIPHRHAYAGKTGNEI